MFMAPASQQECDRGNLLVWEQDDGSSEPRGTPDELKYPLPFVLCIMEYSIILMLIIKLAVAAKYFTKLNTRVTCMQLLVSTEGAGNKDLTETNHHEID